MQRFAVTIEGAGWTDVQVMELPRLPREGELIETKYGTCRVTHSEPTNTEPSTGRSSARTVDEPRRRAPRGPSRCVSGLVRSIALATCPSVDHGRQAACRARHRKGRQRVHLAVCRQLGGARRSVRIGVIAFRYGGAYGRSGRDHDLTAPSQDGWAVDYRIRREDGEELHAEVRC